MYSRQDPVGVSVKMMGHPGEVNQNDATSRNSLPGKTRGKMNLYSCRMSSFQNRSFNQVYKQNKANDFFQLARNVSNFVFPVHPDDIVKGFEHNMQVGDNNTYVATPEFARYLMDENNIRKYSCKFHKIVTLCKNDPGNCFVYGEQVQNGGLYILAACLEAQGFTRYTSQTSVVDTTTGEVLEPLASSDVLRYVIFIGDMQTNFPNIMELMNCKGNAEGKYIKVFVSSKIGREGISIKNVQQIHMVSPEWTSSGIFQATSIGIRAKAHQDLKEVKHSRDGCGSADRS